MSITARESPLCFLVFQIPPSEMQAFAVPHLIWSGRFARAFPAHTRTDSMSTLARNPFVDRVEHKRYESMLLSHSLTTRVASSSISKRLTCVVYQSRQSMQVQMELALLRAAMCLWLGCKLQSEPFVRTGETSDGCLNAPISCANRTETPDLVSQHIKSKPCYLTETSESSECILILNLLSMSLIESAKDL